MAIDPRIALGGQTLDVGRAVGQGLQNAAGIQQLRADKLMGLAMGGDQDALERLKSVSGSKYAQAKKAFADLNEAEQEASLKSYAGDIVTLGGMLQSGDREGALNFLERRYQGLEDNKRDSSHTLRGLQLAREGKWDDLGRVVSTERDGLIQRGYLEPLPQDKSATPTELQKLIQARDALDPNDPNRQAYDARINKISQPSGGQSFSYTAPDGSMVSFGSGAAASELQKPNAREVEERIISNGESLARLKTIKDNYNRDFLTYQGRFNNIKNAIKSKAGMNLSDEDRALLRQRRRFTQGVNTEFNAYRKLITGAAAAVQELESLKKAMISEDLSPDEFEAAFDEYSSELGRSIRIRNRLLREGLRPGTSQFGDSLDQLYISGADDDFETRGDELEAQGASPEEIVDILEQEGYLE